MGDMADHLMESMDMLEDCDGDYPSLPRPIHCKYCKNPGFYWGKTIELGWRLYTETGKLHACSSHPSKKTK